MKSCPFALALSLVAALLPALPARLVAQTGPWTDGELLVETTAPGGQRAICRVVPETGATAVLVTPQFWGGWSGKLAFDSHRGGVLANISLPPDNTFLYRLWLVSSDGTAAAMPGFTGSLRALCPTGDGRIYFLRHFSANQGPKTVEYYDANDALQTLKAADGVTPFQIEVEHLLYDAASNALIGSSSPGWSATKCGTTGCSVYRIPLSGNGSQVAGAVSCASVTSLGANEEIMSLDHLPDGRVLATVASGNAPSTSKLLAVNPVSLAFTTWADPSEGEIEGGVWCARLGKAVLHSAWTDGYKLRTHVAGSANEGTVLATSMPLPGAGGYSPSDGLSEVDVNGPACDGFQVPYGVGLAGSGNVVPLLGVIGCPDIGNVFTISLNSALGGASGILFVGLAPGAFPFKGGTFLLGTIAAQIPIVAGGPAGVAGAGSVALPATLPPAIAGISLYLQAGFADAGAAQGASLSNGLRVQGD